MNDIVVAGDRVAELTIDKLVASGWVAVSVTLSHPVAGELTVKVNGCEGKAKATKGKPPVPRQVSGAALIGSGDPVIVPDGPYLPK